MIRFKVNTGTKFTLHQLPENWAEIPTFGQKMAIVRILLGQKGDEYEQRVAIVRVLLNVSDKQFKRLGNELSKLTITLKWLNIEPSATPVFDSCIHKGVTYYLPKADFANGTAAEFVLALDYYGAYAESKSSDDLLKLVAVLARQSSDNMRVAAEKNDIRVSIHDNGNEVDERAKLLRGLPEEISICILRYFEGVKLMFHTLGVQAELWTEPKEGEEETENVALFGWRTTFRTIAEKGPFGTNYDDVCQRKFWEIFQYLLERKTANDEYERKMQEISKND
jgi:hypothetical protein